MEITEQLVKERFNALNFECFDDEAKMPDKIVVNHSVMQAGSVYQNPRTKKITLSISDMYEMTDATLDNVIAHEMIHIVLIQRYGYKKAGHNKHFKQLMKKINGMYGMNVELNAKNIPFTEKGAKKREKLYPKNKVLKSIIKLFEKVFY